MRGRSNLVEVYRQYLLRQTRDKWVTSVEILTFPSPTDAGENVESHPDIFQCHLMRDAITVRHMPIENNHSGNVERDRRDEECNVGELDQLVVKDDDVVRRNDRWKAC